MNEQGERKRDLLCRCYDVVANEPIGPRQERLRLEIEHWAAAIRDGEEFGLEYSIKQGMRNLRAFLERNEK